MGDHIEVLGEAGPDTGAFQLPQPAPILADQLIAQLKAVAENPKVLKYSDDSQLYDIQRYSREAVQSLEKPFETLRRIAYSKPLLLVVSRIAQEHGILEALNSHEETLTLTELAEITKINAFTLETLMDYLSTHKFVNQISHDQFKSNALTKELMGPAFRDGFIHFHDLMGAGWFSLHKSIREPIPQRTGWQMANNTDLDFYTYVERDDMTMEREALNRFMKTNMDELPTWLEKFDFAAEFGKDITSTDVAFVDVGGGNGHQCVVLKKKYPSLPGRVIVQDRPEVLENAIKVEGMETMSYDYNTEQPIKDARVYYFRTVLHNNTDETCVKILNNQIAAMGPNSVIVIDEKVLPDDKPGPETPGADAVAGLSLAMKMFFNARERREAHWRTIANDAGLAIKDMRRYTDFAESAIILVKK